MKAVKSNFNTILGVFLLIVSILNFTIYKSGYEYRPKSYIAFFAAYLALAAIIIVISVKFRQNVCKTAKIITYVIPIISVIYTVSLLLSFDFSVNYKTHDLIYFELLFAVAVISSIVVFFVYRPVMWIRICAIILTVILSVIFGFIAFISLIFTNFGENTITQTLQSPNNTYVAWTISSDQGALGGDTYVYVRNSKEDVNLLFGTLMTQQKTLWTGGWNAEPILQWADDSNLLIDNVNYNVEYILRTDYINNYVYSSKLKVFVPNRKPDYAQDTHGGFHGDGDRLEKFVLSPEEMKLMEEDIANNAFWNELNSENKSVLYGGAEGYYTSGFLQGNVPDIDTGYYCVYNKQNKTSEFPSPGAYSYNYIIGIYSVDEGILYIFEMDT